MPFVYLRFASVPLVLYDATHPEDSGSMDLGLVPLANGGAYNPHGAGVGHHAGLRLSLAGTLHGASMADLEAQYLQLAALRFTEGVLWRQGLGTGRLHHALAVLTHVAGDFAVAEDGAEAFDLTLDFAVESAAWDGAEHGAGWKFDAGFTFDAGKVFDEDAGDLFTLAPPSPDTAALTNGGTVPQTAVKLTVTVPAATAALTSIRIQGGGTDITWTGTVAAGTALVIDSGGWSVQNGGADAYGTLAINAGHTLSTLFQLTPGTTTYTITYGGGSASTTLLWSYSDAWA